MKNWKVIEKNCQVIDQMKETLQLLCKS